MAEYSYTLDPAEILRYRMMASRALDREADLWDAAGITSNAAVVDLGCGPGIFLPKLASRTAPAGRLVGVDESGPAVTAARQRTGQIERDTITHELVVLPLAPGASVGTRAVGADNKVSEDASVGEASTDCSAGAREGIAPGHASWVTIALKPGRYELLCNLPGHYAAGMYGELDVT